MSIRYIAVHHTGATQSSHWASTQNTRAEDVDAYHKQRWNFVSELGRYGGYNFFIDKDGKVTQFRKVGEETAAQIGHNKDTISICLAGNFSGNEVVEVDTPTDAQEDSLVGIIADLFTINKGVGVDRIEVVDGTIMDLAPERIVPHRFFGNTECNGTLLPDSWARELYLARHHDLPENDLAVIELQYQLIKLLEKLLALFKRKKAGGFEKGCDGFIN